VIAFWDDLWNLYHARTTLFAAFHGAFMPKITGFVATLLASKSLFMLEIYRMALLVTNMTTI